MDFNKIKDNKRQVQEEGHEFDECQAGSCQKTVKVVVAKKQAVQHENRADQIEAFACRRQEEVARLIDDIYFLRDPL